MKSLLPLLQTFNSLFSRTTWLSWHQIGKQFWILLEQRWWGGSRMLHQLDHLEIICTWLQTDNHASTSPLSFYRPDALPATQPTASKHWRHARKKIWDNIWIISYLVFYTLPLGHQEMMCVKHSLLQAMQFPTSQTKHSQSLNTSTYFVSLLNQTCRDLI